MLLNFEILKLVKSRAYLIILGLPWIFLLILIIHFIWNINQSFFDEKMFFFKGEAFSNSNPYYYFSSQYLAGLFILLLPIQSILALGQNQQIDQKCNGWMLIKSTGVKPWAWHLQSFIGNMILLGASMGISLIFLIVCLHFLPILNENIIYNGYQNPWWQVAAVFGLSFLSSIPMHLCHYWVSFLNARLSTSLVMVLVFVILTYTIVKVTPYYLIAKTVSTGLSTIEQSLVFKVDLKIVPLQNLEFHEIWPSVALTLICIVHACYKTR